MRTWVVALCSGVGALMTIGFGIWVATRPEFPDTRWYGSGCMVLETVSVPQVWEQRSVVEASLYARLVDGGRLQPDAVVSELGDAGVTIRVDGFLTAKTATAARVSLRDTMRDLRASVDAFSDTGVFGATDCGTSVRLPVNVDRDVDANVEAEM
jgi:hypothetical protein